MFTGFSDIRLTIILHKILVVETFFDIFLKKCEVGITCIDFFLADATIFSSLFIEIKKSESPGNFFPMDILDSNEIDTRFDEEFCDIRGLHIFDDIFFECFHKSVERTFFFMTLVCHMEHLFDLQS